MDNSVYQPLSHALQPPSSSTSYVHESQHQVAKSNGNDHTIHVTSTTHQPQEEEEEEEEIDATLNTSSASAQTCVRVYIPGTGTCITIFLSLTADLISFMIVRLLPLQTTSLRVASRGDRRGRRTRKSMICPTAPRSSSSLRRLSTDIPHRKCRQQRQQLYPLCRRPHLSHNHNRSRSPRRLFHSLPSMPITRPSMISNGVC